MIESGHTIGRAGVLAAIPYVVASHHRLGQFPGVRTISSNGAWHLIVPTVLAGVCMAGVGLAGTEHVVLLLTCLSLSVGLWFGRITVYWICVGDAVPRGASGAAMGVANGVGNLGGFLGPRSCSEWLRTTSGGFSSSMLIGGIALIVARACWSSPAFRDGPPAQKVAPKLISVPVRH